VKLATRISLFFLVALAVVLAGFSGSIYWIVRAHLYRQVNDRSIATLDTLVASIETGPDGLEWEPNDRSLTFGETAWNKPLLWGVFDPKGNPIGGTTEAASILRDVKYSGGQGFVSQEDRDWNNEPWQISRREILPAVRADNAPPDIDAPAKRYARLLVAVGVSLVPVADQLRTLGLTLAGISISVWLIAALLGGSLCRNALAPLTQMSESIAVISPADLSQRLSPIPTKDQLGELSRAFNQLLERLQTSFERQQRFAADASHQLRTPLTSMLGQVDVALRRERTPDEYKCTLECVREQSARLSQIIEMLLFLAREGADIIRTEFNCFDLNDWLNNHLSTWSHHPRFKNLRLDIDREAELPIRAHEGLLGQAINNLIDNACKYSEPKSEIVLRTSCAGRAVILEIEDHGCGIAETELAHVRDPFFRSEEVRRRGIGGAGLGLSVAQQILSALGSELSIESTPGRGSLVTINFNAQARDGIAERASKKDTVIVAR
jgi:two-component system OmpR family sensor kinase